MAAVSPAFNEKSISRKMRSSPLASCTVLETPRTARMDSGMHKPLLRRRHFNWTLLALASWGLAAPVSAASGQRILVVGDSLSAEYGLARGTGWVALLQKQLDKEKPGVYFMHMPKPCAGSTAVPPHVDRARRTALNIYLKCSNEITEFYEADEETKTLTAVERFVAKPHDMWALDVSKPHAVLMAEAMERSAISISFRRVRYPELIAYFQ
jgi:hypothetical protein